MTGYAHITGRVVGPEGLGRMGTVEFIPLEQYRAVEESGRQVVVAHYTVGRLTANGYLVNAYEDRFIKLAAPASLPVGEKNYRVIIDIPGDMGGRREYLAGIISGTSVDLADIIRGIDVRDLTPPPSVQPIVRLLPNGELEAMNALDVIDVGDGILTWRRGLNG